LILGELIERTARRFQKARLHYGHGTDNAREEAAWLVVRGLGLPFKSRMDREVDERRIEKLIQRRITERIPTAYLLSEAWLGGQRFYVDRRVIVPRSHIAFLLKGLELRPKRVLDVCTGSGCLAILAAQAFPRAKVVGTDISTEALAVARRNIALHKLSGRVRAVRADLFHGEGYDLIIANPPYVASSAMKNLPPEYRWEPGLSLAGGASGLDLVHRILLEAPARLAAQGILVCEVGDGKRALERAYPRAPFLWSSPEVFIMERAKIPAARERRSRQAAARP
jgi:ribosomal protein L3 glutamine methyltransferase